MTETGKPALHYFVDSVTGRVYKFNPPIGGIKTLSGKLIEVPDKVGTVKIENRNHILERW